MDTGYVIIFNPTGRNIGKYPSLLSHGRDGTMVDT